MKTLVLLLTYLSLSACHANYPENINKAEQLAIKGNYAKAATIYTETLSEYQHLTSADYYNLVVCLTKTNQNQLAFRYLDSCIVSGYTIKPFNKVVFTNLHDKKAWSEFKERYDSLRAIYQAHKRTESYKKLAQLVETDQEAAIKMSEENHEYLSDSVFYSNGQTLYRMIQQEAIPEVELFDFESIKYRSTLPWVLIRHYFGMVNRAKIYAKEDNPHKAFYAKLAKDTRLYDALLNLIEQGSLTPNVLRDGLRYSADEELFGKVGLKIIVKKEHSYISDDYKEFEALWIKNNYNDSLIQVYNTHRKKISLSTYQEQMAIATYWKSLDDNIPELKYGPQFRTIPTNTQHLYDLDRIEITKNKEGYEVITKIPDRKGELLEFRKLYPKEQVVKHVVYE